MGTLCALGLGAGSALANFEVVHNPLDLMPNDAIYWDATTLGANEAEARNGFTARGIAFRITQRAGTPVGVYSGAYMLQAARPYTIVLEFARPMAAVGAEVLVGGYRAFGSPAYRVVQHPESPGLVLGSSGYYGLVAGGGIKSLVLTADGPITVGNVDLRPVPEAQPDSLTVLENSTRTFGSFVLLGNDAHAEGAIVVNRPQNAETFALNEDGSFTYHPRKDFNGEDSFTYRATNGRHTAHSEEVKVEIQVLPLNSAPSFVPGPDLECNEDDSEQSAAAWAQQINVGGPDEEGQQLTWEIQVDNPSLFSVLPSLDLDGNLKYTPAPEAFGAAQVLIGLRDDGGTENGGIDYSGGHVLNITIAPRNHAPRLKPISDLKLSDGAALMLNARASERDLGQAITYSLEKAPQGAWIDPISGLIIWNPEPEQRGQIHEFEVKATEHTEASLADTIRFNVDAEGPLVAPELRQIPDIDSRVGESIRFHMRGTSAGGTVQYALGSEVEGPALNPKTGRFIWTPKLEDAGKVYEFTVFATNRDGLTTIRTFAVNVNAHITTTMATKNSTSSYKAAESRKPKAKKSAAKRPRRVASLRKKPTQRHTRAAVAFTARQKPKK